MISTFLRPGPLATVNLNDVNTDLLLVLALLIAAIVMFMRNRPRMDAVALIMIAALPFTGVVSVSETLMGFSDPNIVLIAVLFVLGEGIARTGIARRLGDTINKRAGNNETRLLVMVMMSVGLLGAFMSSTAVVAIFIPVVLRICTNSGMAPSKLMMPLSIAALISGMMTLVATAPNLIVDAELQRQGFDGLGFFQISPFGLVILVLATLYMLMARKWLPDQEPSKAGQTKQATFSDWIKIYHLHKRELRIRVNENSTLVGSSLEELDLRNEGINLLAIERQQASSRLSLRKSQKISLMKPLPKTVIDAGDVLILDMHTGTERQEELIRQYDVSVLPLNEGNLYLQDQSQNLGMVEAIVTAESKLIGSTILEARMRSDDGITVIGIRRGAEAIADNMLNEVLIVGDVLLITGFWDDIRRSKQNRLGLIPINLPKEMEEVLPAADKAPIALAILLLVVVMMVMGVLPNVQVVLMGVLLMGMFGIIDMPSSYNSISWKSLVLIVGMMPFSMALQRTGGVDLAADAMLAIVGLDAPYFALTLLFVVAALLGMFISNTATAILMAPVAIKIAGDIGASPYPFIMTLALAASASFMTPVSSPVNTLVVVPGNYSFGDFMKVGIPLTIIVLIVAVIMVPLLMPFY